MSNGAAVVRNERRKQARMRLLFDCTWTVKRKQETRNRGTQTRERLGARASDSVEARVKPRIHDDPAHADVYMLVGGIYGDPGPSCL